MNFIFYNMIYYIQLALDSDFPLAKKCPDSKAIPKNKHSFLRFVKIRKSSSFFFFVVRNLILSRAWPVSFEGRQVSEEREQVEKLTKKLISYASKIKLTMNNKIINTK